MIELGLPLDEALPPGGYAWWYVDVVGDDSPYALTAIFFRGNPFSPFYRRALDAGGASPDDFCAVNVVLYRGSRKLWTFTERGPGALVCAPERLAIGEDSALCLDGGGLNLSFDLRSPLIGARLRGAVEVAPSALFGIRHALDGRGLHTWYPMAPISRATVTLQEPALAFRGKAYFDGNAGDEPLGAGFDRWYWMRARSAGESSTSIVYDAQDRLGGWTRFCRHFSDAGVCEEQAAACEQRLPLTRWLLRRSTRVGTAEQARLERTLESAPFYARSLIRVDGGSRGQRLAMHEVMDLSRFRRRLIQAAFYLRMRRQTSWSERPTLGLWARLRP